MVEQEPKSLEALKENLPEKLIELIEQLSDGQLSQLKQIVDQKNSERWQRSRDEQEQP